MLRLVNFDSPYLASTTHKAKPASCVGPRWTGQQLALLGKMPDDEVARLTGRTVEAVRIRRTRLGIPTFRDRRTRR